MQINGTSEASLPVQPWPKQPERKTDSVIDVIDLTGRFAREKPCVIDQAWEKLMALSFV